ncbi:hypothetical protein LEP1GSC029_1348 [Leptospira interrogans str. 2002000626]|uniref:Uncharacterized protein n=1 Tax=Leptospira interrogans str. 2002000626 TaxID=996803 RepID=A0A829CUU1_LEPIR|nr:hypothetical protein LEP1GSC029_1348 [Leptospira interrogans str. 2002000626]
MFSLSEKKLLSIGSILRTGSKTVHLFIMFTLIFFPKRQLRFFLYIFEFGILFSFSFFLP